MKWSKAMYYIKEKADILRVVHAPAASQKSMRSAYYYYGLICLAALAETKNVTKEEKIALEEMDDEIRAVHASFQSQGFKNLSTYALNFYNRVKMDYPGDKYELADEMLKVAQDMAAHTTEILDAYHLLGSILKRDYFFTKTSFANDQKSDLATGKWQYTFHIYKNKERIGQYRFQCSMHSFSIGRDSSNTIVISDPGISRKHVLVEIVDAFLFFKDTNSSAGIFINNQKVKPNTYLSLSTGANFRLGTDIEIYIEQTALENPLLKKCTTCGADFVTNKSSQTLCFACQSQSAIKTGKPADCKFSYFEDDHVRTFAFACQTWCASGYTLDIARFGIGKQLLMIEKLEKNADANLKQTNFKEIVNAPAPAQKKDDIPKVPVNKIEEPNNSLLSRCRFIKEIGKGGMGIVYLIEDTTTHKQYAFKQIKSQQYPPGVSKEAIEAHEKAMISSFLREANLHMHFKHPYVASVHEVGVYKNSPYIIMEYYKDGTLTTHYNRIKNDPKKYELVRQLFLQILEGLDYLHHAEVSVTLKNGTTVSTHGIVHRDLKPDNIFIEYDSLGNPMIKIADFGMSKAYEVASQTNFTAVGNLGGTLEFMPKQQLTDYKFCKPDVDIWAAAASIYALLTSNVPKPFRTGIPRTTTVMHESAIPIRVYNKNVPRKFAKIIDRALVDKELYYKHAKDLIHDLNKIKC